MSSILLVYLFRRKHHMVVKNHLHSSSGVQESRVRHTYNPKDGCQLLVLKIAAKIDRNRKLPTFILTYSITISAEVTFVNYFAKLLCSGSLNWRNAVRTGQFPMILLTVWQTSCHHEKNASVSVSAVNMLNS